MRQQQQARQTSCRLLLNQQKQQDGQCPNLDHQLQWHWRQQVNGRQQAEKHLWQSCLPWRRHHQ